jgi:hypothetical protein
MRDRTKIRDTRTRAAQNQRRKLRNLIMNSATVVAILSLVGGIVAMVAGILKNLR